MGNQRIGTKNGVRFISDGQARPTPIPADAVITEAAETRQRNAPMARLPRFDLPGVAQHIVQRGNDRQPCFADDADYLHYRQELGEAARTSRASPAPGVPATWIRRSSTAGLISSSVPGCARVGGHGRPAPAYPTAKALGQRPLPSAGRSADTTRRRCQAQRKAPVRGSMNLTPFSRHGPHVRMPS